MEILKANNRGKADFGWLKANYYFSFAYYYNPKLMGHGVLRVINHDSISYGHGFDTHPHRNMEIITFILKGSLRHKDSMGSEGVIYPGEIQLMSAGTGVAHSEFNASEVENCELFQIWIVPNRTNTSPRYAQMSFSGDMQLLVSPDGRLGSLVIYQNAFISKLTLKRGQIYNYKKYDETNLIYIISLDGIFNVNGIEISDFDSVALTQTENLQLINNLEHEVQAIIFEIPELSE